jgi:phosphatidate cytidylyltransferase
MRDRVRTALIVFPVVLLAISSSYLWPVTLLGIVIALLGHPEVSEMVSGKKYLIPVFGTIVILIVSGLYGIDRERLHRFIQPYYWSTIWAGLICLMPLLSRSRDRRKIPFLESEYASTTWLIIPIICMFWLHQERGIVTQVWNFKSPLLLPTLPTMGGDIAAIFVGRAFGRHPMAPQISPNKTWEGSIGNFLVCVALAVGIATWIGLDLPTGLACGVAAGIFGQIGDLYESYLKRLAGIKDSGTLLPGHGGVMDRMDAMLFAAPAVAAVLCLMTHR